MRKNNIIWVTASLLATSLMAACGGRQDTADPKPPELRPPEPGTCPGALPTENVQLSGAIGESNAPVVAWTGASFEVAWWDLRGQQPQIRRLQVDRTGAAQGQADKILSKDAARDQSLAWDGRELNLVFSEGNSVMSARLGALDETPQKLAEDGRMPAAGQWGAAVWVDSGKLMFQSDVMRKQKEDGVVDEEPVPVAIAAGGIEDPKIAFNGQFYAVAWSSSVKGGREILLQRVSPKGRRLGGLVRVSAVIGTSRKPAGT